MPRAIEQAEAAETTKIPVTMGPTLLHGIKTIVGAMPVGLMVHHYKIPRRDALRKRGYQREVSPLRVKKLTADLVKDRVDLPTAVLLSLRGTSVENLLVKDAGGRLYMPVPDDGDFGPFYVVDGQHRLEAIKKLAEDEPDPNWGERMLPFVCMVGASEGQEMKEFYVVNSNAKSVRTDLALDLLKQRAESDPEFMNSLIERGEQWKVNAQTISERLSKEALVWRDRIRFPNCPKGRTTVPSSGMVSSLKPLLATPYFGAVNLENQVKILDAYWKGIKKVLPGAFENPESYSIQKGSGATVLHAVLIHVLEYIRSKGASVIEPESYREAMEDALRSLQGDTPSGEVAAGENFWRVGPEGAAGAFSSNAARRVLIAKIKSQLPEPDVE